MSSAQAAPTPQPAMPGLDPDRAERAARMLDRFAEMAMQQAEVLHQAVMAAAQAGDAGGAKEFGLAFDRVGRGLRRALALQLHFARKQQEADEHGLRFWPRFGRD